MMVEGRNGIRHEEALVMRDLVMDSSTAAPARSRLIFAGMAGNNGTQTEIPSIEETTMRTRCLRMVMLTVATLSLVVPGAEGRRHLALAQAVYSSTAAALRDGHCPTLPENVPPTLLPASSDTVKQGVSVVGDTLVIKGTPNPDHILLKAAQPAGVINVVFDGLDLGNFGPVASILVQAGDGDDVVVAEPQVVVPIRMEGGAGDDCLEGGSGPDQLFGEEGNDILVGTPGRDALHAGPGSNHIIVAASMGEIRVTPSAGGALLPNLATAYTLRTLHADAGRSRKAGAAHNGTPSPIIVGAVDLSNARLHPLLREAYEAGQAVALTDATPADAARLQSLLGHPSTVDATTDAAAAALIYVRKAPRPGGRFDYRTGTFASPPMPVTPAQQDDADERTTELLSQVFSTTAIVPQLPEDSPENNLINLADSVSQHIIGPKDSYGNQLQITNRVYSVRSFGQKSDLYYVNQELDVYSFGDDDTIVGVATSVNNLSPWGDSLIKTSPDSTQCTTSTTSGVSESIGGSAGWNQQQGFNAVLTGGVTISDSQTVTCPAIIIENQSNLTNTSQWEYDWTPLLGTRQTFYNKWIWVSEWSSYGSTQAVITIYSDAQSNYATLKCDFGTEPCPSVSASMNMNVPFPFGTTFALQQPVVLSVSSTCVNAGDKFTITGTGLYPSLVTGVVIGGTPVDSRLLTFVNDKAITVIAPDQSGDSLPVVVQTTQGSSNDNVTIEISTTGACHQ
jgi:hypothetical protein